MRIESALNASREGLQSHGQAITVISDNISNSNTSGFKAARAEFSDIYAEYTGIKDGDVIKDGGGSQVTRVRPIQISGEAEFTGRSLDVAVEGNGFFITGDKDATPGSISYTRAGNFELDKDGYLTTTGGRYVFGSTTAAGAGAGAAAGTTTTAPTLSRLNLATIQSGAAATSTINLGGNVSSSLPITTVPTAFASATDLGKAASHIETIEAFDSLGTQQTVTLGFFKTATNTWTVNAYVDGGSITGGTAGTPVQVGSVSGLTFSEDGKVPTANQATAKLTATPAWSSGATAGNFAIDLSQYTQYASASALASKSQDGSGVGEIKSYDIDKGGKVNATLSNGTTVSVGTLQLATFVNVDGLERVGSNSFVTGSNAGKVTIGAPGSGGLGVTRGASLERSTTDLSGEFVTLVVMQRGYQANSQALNAANDIMKDTIGLIR